MRGFPGVGFLEGLRSRIFRTEVRVQLQPLYAFERKLPTTTTWFEFALRHFGRDLIRCCIQPRGQRHVRDCFAGTAAFGAS